MSSSGYARRLAHPLITALAVALSVQMVAGCRDGSSATRPEPRSGRPPTATAACDEATPIDADNPLGPEVRGVAVDASLYGLMFTSGPPPVRVGDEVKIVWRMTGTGDVVIRVVDPSGEDRPLTFGPEPHGGSNYDRPGDEWGSGFLFDTVGCWRIVLERNVGSGEVWIDVVPDDGA